MMVNITKDKVGYLVILFGVIFLPGCAKKQYPQGLTKAEKVIYDAKATYKEVTEEFVPGLKILTIEDEKKKEVELAKVIFAKNKEWQFTDGIFSWSRFRSFVTNRNSYTNFQFIAYGERIIKVTNDLDQFIRKLKKFDNQEESAELIEKLSALNSALYKLCEYIEIQDKYQHERDRLVYACDNSWLNKKRQVKHVIIL